MRLFGILGNASGVINVPDRPGYQYARIERGSERVTIAARGKVRPRLNTAIILEQDPITGEFVIKELDIQTTQAAGDDPSTAVFGTEAHASSHIWGPEADDILLWLHPAQMYFLRCQPSGTPGVITMQGGPYFCGGRLNWKRDQSNIDLTSYYPASGSAWVMVCMNADENISIVQREGGGDALDLEELGGIPTGYIAVYAVQLVYGSDFDFYADFVPLWQINQFDTSLVGGGVVIIEEGSGLYVDLAGTYPDIWGEWAGLAQFSWAGKDFFGLRAQWDSDFGFFGTVNEGPNRKDAVIVFGDDTSYYPALEDSFVVYAYGTWDGATVELREVLRVTSDGMVHLDAVVFDLTPSDVLAAVGVLSWNADEETLDLQLPNGVVGQLLQELFFNAKNQTGVTITDGTPVMFAGTLGASGRIKITPAIADGSNPSSYFVGLVTESIIDGADGKVTWFGKVRGIQTDGANYGESWSDGDLIYVSTTTPGYLTNVRPTGASQVILVAAVVYAHATAGTILVRPTWFGYLDDLTGVDVQTKSEGQVIKYNETTENWENAHAGELPIFADALRRVNGFEKDAAPPTDSVITYNPATREITIAPTGASFFYWLDGIRYEVTSAQTPAAHANASGIYFFYWNSSGVLTFSTTPWSIMRDVPIAYVLYNATLADGRKYEERHGALRDRMWHYETHFRMGAFWHSGEGLGISGYTLQPVSPADSDNQWAIDAGYVHDEDIEFPITGRTAGTYLVFSRDGAAGDWTWLSNNVPLLAAASGYVYWNEWTGSTWQLTEGANGKYINYFIFVTPCLDADADVLVLMGQAQHDSLISALAETAGDLNFGDVVFQEVVSAYKITFRLGSSYGTEGQCRIESVDDTRLSTGRQVVSAPPATDHESLGGLLGGDAAGHYHLTGAEHGEATQYATTAQAGLVTELATEDETAAGTDTVRAVTPAGLAGALPALAVDVLGGIPFDADGLLLFGPGCTLNDSEWISRRGHVADITGAFHLVHGLDPITRALMVEGGTTNLIKNPVMGDVTTFWTSVSAGTKTLDNDSFLFHAGSMKLTADGTGACIARNASGTSGISVSAGVAYAISAYAMADVSSTQAAYIGVWWYDSVGAFISTSTSSEGIAPGDGWGRITDVFTSPAGAAYAAVLLRIAASGTSTNGNIVRFDGVQFEQKSFCTSLCWGDAGPGYAWSSTPHASTSTRTATQVNLDSHVGLVSGNNTVSTSIWIQAQYDYDGDWPATSAYIVDMRDAAHTGGSVLYYSPSGHYIVWWSGSNVIISSTITFSAGDWLHVALTEDFSSNEYVLYLNGAQIGSSAASLTAPTINEWNLGQSYSGASNFGGWAFDEYAVFDRVLTNDEIAGQFASRRAMVDSLAIHRPDLFSLLPVATDEEVAAATDGVIPAVPQLGLYRQTNGALQADVDGDARGAYAIDLQQVRGSSDQVAAGDYSLNAGRGNKPDGDYSITVGYGAHAELYAEFAHAAAPFSVCGDAQRRVFVLRAVVDHDDGVWFTIYVGGTDLMVVPEDSAWNFRIQLIGLTSGAAQRWSYDVRGTVVNDGGTVTVLESAVTTCYESDSAYDAQVVANATYDSLDLQVRRSGGTSYLIRWVAVVEVAQAEF